MSHRNDGQQNGFVRSHSCSRMMETRGIMRKRHIGGASALDSFHASGEAQTEFQSPVSIWGWRYTPLDALILCVCMHMSYLCKCVYVSCVFVLCKWHHVMCMWYLYMCLLLVWARKIYMFLGGGGISGSPIFLSTKHCLGC